MRWVTTRRVSGACRSIPISWANQASLRRVTRNKAACAGRRSRRIRSCPYSISTATPLNEAPMPPVAAAVIALIGLVLVFSAVWAWQLKSENAGMVDPVWAYSLGAVAVLYAVLGKGDSSTRVLAALGGLVWGVRLGTHLWRRNFGQPEDARYRRFREEWGDAAPRRMFWFFQLQVVISMLLSLAFLVPAYRSSEPAT